MVAQLNWMISSRITLTAGNDVLILNIDRLSEIEISKWTSYRLDVLTEDCWSFTRIPSPGSLQSVTYVASLCGDHSKETLCPVILPTAFWMSDNSFCKVDISNVRVWINIPAFEYLFIVSGPISSFT